MRLSNAEHEAYPWRIREIAPDFTLEDVWAIPVYGGAGDFERLIAVMTALDPVRMDSRPARVLFGVRTRLGAWFGWDDDAKSLPIPGDTETTLRARLPEDLHTPTTMAGTTPFVPLFQTEDEWAAEISNKTVHAIMHVVWIAQGEGRYRGQMGVYVKPRGRFGAAYMKFIAPFRHLVVYPALLRQIERSWDLRNG